MYGNMVTKQQPNENDTTSASKMKETTTMES